MKTASLLLATALPFSRGHILFDEVGALAGAVSYTHVAINVDLTSLTVAHQQVEAALNDFDTRFQQRLRQDYQGIESNDPNHAMNRINRTQLQVSSNQRYRLRRTIEKIDQIRMELPQTPKVHKRQVKQVFKAAEALTSVHHLLKQDHVNSFGIITNIINMVTRGTFGNFLSIFSPAQLGAIRANYQKMAQVFLSHDKTLKPNKRILEDLSDVTTTQLLQIVESASDFDTAMDNVEIGVQKVVSALQQVHHRRLSIDLIPAEQLLDLYKQLQDIARETGTELLITAASHMFQLETSFLFDGSDVALLLHVPLIPPGTLATLLKLRPFPIPLTEGDALMPKESPELLAITDSPTKWTTIQQYSLMNCPKINNIYVCPGYGVLRDDPENHCLGALYHQKTALAVELCDMDVIPEQELAIALERDRFLLYTLQEHTATLSCPNAREQHLSLKVGVTEQLIPEGCQLRMQATTVYSHFNLRMPANIRMFDWTPAVVSDFSISNEDIDEFRLALPAARRGRMALSEIIDNKKRWYQRKEFRTMAIVSLSGVLIIGAVMLTLFSVLYKFLIKLRTRHPSLDNEIEMIKNFVHEKLDHINNISIRIPDVPTDSPSSRTGPLTKYEEKNEQSKGLKIPSYHQDQ